MKGDRDDLLTGIHKALRLGLLRVTVQLGAADARQHLAPQAYAHLLAVAEEVLAPEPWRRTVAGLEAAA
jgi:hypothetical protein